MTPVAYLVQIRFRGPPALVTFLPAFWPLTPGALGVISLTEMVSPNHSLGILTGAALARPLLRA
jgi:uncharacterized membrane protein YjjB (DUF3815 family)